MNSPADDLPAPSDRKRSLLEMASRIAKVGGWAFQLEPPELIWSDELALLYEEPAGYTPSLDDGLRYFAAEDQVVITDAVGLCATNGDPFEFAVSATTAKGRRLWVRMVGEAVRDRSGAILAVQGAVQDITEHHTAGDKILQLEGRLKSTLDSISDAFFTVDQAWRFTYINATAERHLNRAKGELLGRVLWDEFAGSASGPSGQAYRRAVAEQVTVHFEEFYPRTNSWFEVEAYPSSNGLAVYFRDTTERRRSREAIRESEERFRLLAKANHDAVWDWDLATDMIWWNDGFHQLFGYPGPVFGVTGVSWEAKIHPDDREGVLQSIRATLASADDTWSADYRFLRHDLSYAYVHDRGFVARDSAGTAVRMIGAMADLSERRRVEAKLREQATLLDKANDAIIVRDLEHRVIYWNKSAERLCGWMAAEVPPAPVQEWLYPDAGLFLRATEATLSFGEWSGELEKNTRGRGTVVVEARWTLVRDETGLPTSILAIQTDVTQRKKLESQFLRAQRMESIGALAGGIAHDLNNTLAPILMTVAAMRDGENDANRLEDLATIHTAAQRGADMVRQLLTFARGGEDRREIVDLRRVVSDVRAMVRDSFPKSVQFQSIILSHWPVRANATQMHQLLTNLCVNARDAMPRGGSLQVTVEQVVLDEVYVGMNVEAKAGPYVLLRVEDTGTGMPPHILEKVFEPFFTTKEVGKGTGLGLSTVHEIVRNHGGFVHIYSEVGIGTRFHVYLPAEVDAEISADAAIELTKLPRGNGECILVVDDEEAIRTVAKRTLERFGYRVLLACHGAEALSIYVQHRSTIAVVITDMTMPVMDGPATIIALKIIEPKVRIVGSSGLTANGNVAKAAGAGVEHFVPKPYTAEAILRAIHDILSEPEPGTTQL